MGQRCLKLAAVFRIGVEGVFMADRFRITALADGGVEPSPRVEPLSLSGKRESPFAEAGFENIFFQSGEIADAPDPERVKVLLHDLADAWHLAHFKRREKARLHAG